MLFRSGLPHCRQTLYHLNHQGSPGSTRQSSKPAWEEGHSLRADHWSLRACENLRAGEQYMLRSRASYRGHGGRWFSPSLRILSISFRQKNYSPFLLPHTLDLDPMLFARTTATGFQSSAYCLSSLLPGIKEKKLSWVLEIYLCLVQLHQTYGSLKDA